MYSRFSVFFILPSLIPNPFIILITSSSVTFSFPSTLISHIILELIKTAVAPRTAPIMSPTRFAYRFANTGRPLAYKTVAFTPICSVMLFTLSQSRLITQNVMVLLSFLFIFLRGTIPLRRFITVSGLAACTSSFTLPVKK